jgi:hypothetical protein
MMSEQLNALLPFLIPIAILQIGLIIFALLDLRKRERTKGPKWLWAVIILFVNIIGPLLYFVIGRED